MPFQIPGTSITISRKRNQARHSPSPSNALETQASGQPNFTSPPYQLNDDGDTGRSTPSPTLNTWGLQTSLSPSTTASPIPEGSVTSQALSPKCASCGKPMEGAFVRALGAVHHLSCFKCMDCGQSVASKFFPIDGPEGKQHPLCERDYFRRLNYLCASCGEAVRGSYIRACDKKYHVEHFTCSVCLQWFGPQDSYYEHDGDVYCHYHYSTRCAERCAGCKGAILKKFVEIKTKNEVWHPECYMINKFWNVKVVPKRLNTSATDEGSQKQSYLEEEDKETAISLKEKQDKMERKIARIWTELSAFEESGAASISDMLRQVSDGQYLNAIHLVEKTILHIETLFAVIDDLEFRFISLGLKGYSHVREARMLCRKFVELLTLLSHAQDQQTADQGKNMTQELLALVTGFAHYFKILIRIALTAALKLEREQNDQEAVDLLLDRLHMFAEQGSDPTARRVITGHSDSAPSHANRSTEGVAYGFRSLAPETAGESPFTPSALRDNQLSLQKLPSDLCIKCHQTVEEDCVRLSTYQRWHSNCIQCAVCGKVALLLASKGQSLASSSDQGTEKALNQSEKPSIMRRLPANVELFVYDPKTIVEMPFGEAPTAIYCIEHGHSNCRGGFEPVNRLEQYAFLLNVALRRLYLLLKKKGVISLSPVAPTSLGLMSYKPSSTSYVLNDSVIIENPARKTTHVPDSPPVLDEPPQVPKPNTTQHTSSENLSDIKDSPGHYIQQDESHWRAGKLTALEPQSPTTVSTHPPPAVPNQPQVKYSTHRPAQPSITKSPSTPPPAPAPIRPLPQPPLKTQPASLPTVQGAPPAPALPLASPSSVPTQAPLIRGASADHGNPSTASVPSIQVSKYPPVNTDVIVPESGPSLQSSPAPTPSTTSTQDSPQANANSRFFNQAHNFAILNPSMYDIGAQHNYYLGFTNVLDCLAKYTMTGVEYNSSIREYSPRCHPGTREEIVQDIQAGLHNPDQKVKMIWMYGPAGVGKSAIMQTLAETWSQDTLGAALFISKADKRNESRRVLPTIAYQLAVRNPSYQAYIGERLKADPKFLEKSLAEQFESLVTVPFTGERIVLSGRFTILIDGLDECQSERDQCKIIDLIRNFVAHHPTSPLTWVIGSRPELHLQTAFARAEDNLESYKKHRISIHSEQASRDVESYLRHEFTRVQQNHPDSISSASPWPTNRQFTKIAHASSGLFLFASSVLGFIDSGDPVSRLHRTLALLDDFGSRTPSPNENPFQMLDALYAQIMSEIPADMLSVTKALLGYYLPRRNAFPAHNEEPFLLACNLLGVERHIAYGALRKFYSVLAFPSSANAHQEALRFLHTSFADYLRSPARSKIYFVDLSHTMTEQWRYYARILVEWLDGYSHECVKLSWVPDLENQHHAAYELRETMFNQASSSWTVMLYRHCHSWCPASCMMKVANPACLVLSLSEVSSFLRRMDFGVPTPFGKDPVDMLDFLTWIRDHTPLELRREIVAQEFPLNKLKIPRFFQALCEKKWYRGVTERYRRFEVEIDGQGIEQIGPLDTSEWETAEEILQGDEGMLGDLVRLVLESRGATEVMVTVLGADPAKCCGIVRYQKSPTEAQYHIFPYGEIYLQGSPRLTMVSLD